VAVLRHARCGHGGDALALEQSCTFASGRACGSTVIPAARPGCRHVVVVATAGIPWMTGTAVNPTLRAAYLAKCTDLKVPGQESHKLGSCRP
jgi:hypothetical protein